MLKKVNSPRQKVSSFDLKLSVFDSFPHFIKMIHLRKLELCMLWDRAVVDRILQLGVLCSIYRVYWNLSSFCTFLECSASEICKF